MRKKDVKFYRVDNFKNYPAFLVPSDYLLQHLLQQVQLQQLYSNFELFLHSTLLEEQHLSRTLEQIVAALHPDRDLPPTFYVCELADPDQLSPEDQEYYGQIQQLMNLESESVREQWRGANGHVLFEGRDNSLMASSVDKSAKVHKMKSTEDLIAKIGEGEVPAAEKKSKKKMEVENIAQVIKELKQAHSKEKAESRGAKTDLKYSNFDINFVTTLEQTYLSYMLRSGLKLHYVDYPAWNFAVIEKQLTQTDRVGIIGDYGTGLPDSYELLENMVVNQGVTVILHLGDVYYAGTPEEYETNVMQFLRKLRMKVKRQLLFYSIPGNHDYYSWGLPFLCFVREANSEEFAKQQASYFCLRSEDNRWQFLGADTAYHDANPLDQINQTNLGPRLRKTELAWHKHKMESFPGSTIFLSHHQLYSIHDRLCGSLSQYRNFSCMNPLLSQQLFEYMPYFSAWYWGHQHAFMLFKESFWGVPLCRLLGNSSFHVVYQKEHPYHRKKGFPLIPFIRQDEEYLARYLPLEPEGSNPTYFNLSYAVIDFGKSGENLLVEYFCSPGYSEQEKKLRHFKSYKLYEEIIQSREKLVERASPILRGVSYYMKSEIGLLLSYSKDLILDFAGCLIQLDFQREDIADQAFLQIRICHPDLPSCYLSHKGSEPQLLPEPSPQSLWKLSKKYVMQDSLPNLTTMHTFSLSTSKNRYLGWRTASGRNELAIAEREYLWMFLPPSQALPPPN